MNPDLKFGALAKPLKGTATLKRRERRAEVTSHEKREMAAAKARDGGKCRWPACCFNAKKLRIDSAHIFRHRGMAGDPSMLLTRRDLCMALCIQHHQLLDNHDLSIQPLTDQNADGICAFYVRAENGRLEHFCSERLLGVPETRT